MRAIKNSLVVATLGMTSACALLGKSEPITSRYFSPETATSSNPPSRAGTGLELRFGRVNADAAIRDRIAYRDATYEVRYYDDWVWTDKPEAYVRRALTRALYDGRGVRQVLSGFATTIEVDLVAFEEVREPAHVGRVELSFLLYDDRVVRLSRSVVVDRAIAPAKGDAAANAVVRALGEALAAAVEAVADSTVAELRADSASARTTP